MKGVARERSYSRNYRSDAKILRSYGSGAIFRPAEESHRGRKARRARLVGLRAGWEQASDARSLASGATRVWGQTPGDGVRTQFKARLPRGADRQRASGAPAGLR